MGQRLSPGLVLRRREAASKELARPIRTARRLMPDVIVIGGGHNGLVAAAYLAAAGLKVTVLERRAVVGGAAVTEEFHPGFRNSVAAYTVSLLNPKSSATSIFIAMGSASSSARCRTSCPCRTGAI